MKRRSPLIGEFFHYLQTNKRWWMIPPIIVFFIVGMLIAFASSTPLSPFIYALF